MGKNLSEELWESTINIAEESLSSFFLRNASAGLLDVGRYVHFVNQDMYYIEAGTSLAHDAWKEAIASNSSLEPYLASNYAGYAAYFANYESLLGLSSSSCVNAKSTIRQYSAWQRQSYEEGGLDAYLISIAPCEILWNWLGFHLSYTSANPYYSFLSNFKDPSGTQRIENAINMLNVSNFQRYQSIYETAMNFENTLFQNA